MPNYAVNLKKTGYRPSEVSGTLLQGPKPAVQKTPDWKAKLRRGEILPITDWKRRFCNAKLGNVDVATGWEMVERDGSPIWWTQRYSGSHAPMLGVSGSLGYYSSPNSSSGTHLEAPQHLIDRLQLDAIDKAKNSAWDVGTFAAEANKTYGLLRNAHSTTFKRAQKILDRKVGKVKTAAEFADAWLEYRYGWRILAYDIESAQDSVLRLKEHKELHRYTSYGSVRDQALGVYDDIWAGDKLLRHNHDGPGVLKTSITSELLTEIRVGAGVEATSVQAFTLNPLMTAWELIPYSFIMDWFVDVGTFIGAHTPTFGRSLRYVWVSTRGVRTDTATVVLEPTGDAFSSKKEWGYNKCTPAVVEWVWYHRYPVATSAPFSLSYNPRLDLSKFADLAALAFKQRDISRVTRL